MMLQNKRLARLGLILIMFMLTTSTIYADLGDDWEWDSKPDPIGLTIVEEAKIRVAPDLEAEVIQQVPFGTLLYGWLESAHDLWSEGWYEIYLESGQQAWISIDEAHIYYFANCYGEEEGDAWLYLHIAKDMIWNRRDPVHLQAADSFLQRLLEYPDQQVLFIDVADGNDWYESLRVATLDALADSQEDPREGIRYLKMITEESTATERNKARALYEIIYKYREFDLEQSIQATYRLIREYSDFELTGFEWNVWLDLEAAHDLMLFFYEEEPDPERLLQVSIQMMEETSNGAVYHIGAAGKTAALIQLGQVEAAYEMVVEAIRRYPMEIREYYMDEENYTLYPLGFALDLLEEQGEYRAGIEFAERVREMVHNSGVRNYAKLRIAQLWDFGPGARDQVLDLYKLAPSGEMEMPYGLYRQNNRERTQAIQNFEVKTGVVNAPKVEFRSGLNSPDSELLEPGTEVTLLYQLELEKRDDKIGALTKVKLAEDGRIGWIFGGYITKNERLHLYPVQPEEQIQSPTVIAQIPEVIREVVLVDLNHDQIDDLLTSHDSLGLVAIDGDTGDYLWNYQVKGYSSPVIADDQIFIIGSHRVDEMYEQRLEVLEFTTGVPLHQVLLSESSLDDLIRYVPPIIDGQMVILASDLGVKKINYQTGSLEWEFPMVRLSAENLVKMGSWIYLSGKVDAESAYQLYCLYDSTGEIRWDSERGNGYNTTIGYRDGQIYFNNGDGGYYMLSAFRDYLAFGGHKNEIEKVQNGSWSQPVFGPDETLFVTYGHTLWAMNDRKAQIKWSYELEASWYSRNQFVGQPVLLDGLVVVGTQTGSLLAFSMANGELEWEFRPVEDSSVRGYYSPTVHHGRIFWSLGGKLYIIGGADSASGQGSQTAHQSPYGLKVEQVDDRFGYVNPQGELVIPAMFFGAAEMRDGRALVLYQSDTGDRTHLAGYGFVDSEGIVVKDYLDSITSSYSLASRGEPGERLIVVCRSGLSLRETPASDGERLAVVRPGQEVVLLEDPAPRVEFTYDGLKGYWAYVDYYGQKGYIFSGYLSKLPNPWSGWSGYYYESTDSFSWYFYLSIGAIEPGHKVWLSDSFYVELTRLRLGIVQERYVLLAENPETEEIEEKTQMLVYHLLDIDADDLYLVTKLLVEDDDLQLRPFDEEALVEGVTFTYLRGEMERRVTFQKVEHFVQIWIEGQ